MDPTDSCIERLSHADAIDRLSDGDVSLFSDDREVQASIKDRLGWVTLASDAHDQLDFLKELSEETTQSAITDIVLLGMGGSSLSALVIDAVLASTDYAKESAQASDIRLHVLDTVCPEEIARLLGRISFASTLVIVSSKSGTTTEPLTLSEILFTQAREELGAQAPAHFIAITDENTPLKEAAEAQHWRRIITAPDDVGGRFSALSVFGLVPAAMQGLDISRMIDSAAKMESSCRYEEAFANPAARLAAFIGDAAAAGRNQLFLIIDERLKEFGLWVEQLIGESLGKQGRGIILINTSADRLPFINQHNACVITLGLEGAPELFDEVRSSLNFSEEELEHYLTEYALYSPFDIGAEFIRWEFATALLGFLTGVNPFDQPDVAASKLRTREFLDGTKSSYNDRPLSTLASEIEKSPNDYIALLVYGPRTRSFLAETHQAGVEIEQRFGLPVMIAEGPRYLHSIGQLLKGGPNSCICIIIGQHATTVDIEIHSAPYTLDDLWKAQRRGDIESLLDAGRRVYTASSIARMREQLGWL